MTTQGRTMLTGKEAGAIVEALFHAQASYHHPACKAAKPGYGGQDHIYCTCHVQKAREALARLRSRIPMKKEVRA